MMRKAVTGTLLLLLTLPATTAAARTDSPDQADKSRAAAEKAKAQAAARQREPEKREMAAARKAGNADSEKARAAEKQARAEKATGRDDKRAAESDEKQREAAMKRREDRKNGERKPQKPAGKPAPAETEAVAATAMPPVPEPAPVSISGPVLGPVSTALAAPQWSITNGSIPVLISAWAQAGAPDPGLAPGERLLVSFDAPNAAGVFARSSGTVITAAGSIGGVRAAPAGNGSIYQSLGSNSQSTFDFSGWSKGRPLHSLSFEWGSIDSYNFVDFINHRGETVWTLAGSDLPLFNGDQQSPITNQRLYFNFQRGADVTAMRMRSTGIAFEYDSIAASRIGAVPEPGVWALLIIGFGFIGHGLRRRTSARISTRVSA